MNFKETIALLKYYFGDDPIVLTAAAIGGIGIVNVLDSVAATQLSFSIIPEMFFPIFNAIRIFWQWLIAPLLAYLPFKVSEPLQSYMLMGVIVAGMRFRSSMVIWEALNKRSIDTYKQKTIIPNRPVILKKGECLKLWGLFLPIRLIYAFLVWPDKILGAASRYNKKGWDNGFSEGAAKNARQKQYATFFGSITWSLLIIFICLVLRSV